MAAEDTKKQQDPALARTIASGGIPRTHTPATDVASRDPALAATMMPAALTNPGARVSSTLTAEHPGRYVREAELGRGGMGRVIVVKDTHLGRDVALKELLDQSTPGNDAMSIGSAARFLREARITGQLEHPGIVPVHELGQRADGTIYYTMKRIRGRSLASVLKEKTTLAERLPLLAVFRNVCEAVAYAHSRGVVHRDLKPDNVMVGEFGDTLVVDWGLAKVRGEAEIAQERVSGQSGRQSSHDDLAKTMDGHAIGTPAYMSPEQARGELGSIDERADVWGLGTILFEILAGRAPYSGTSALDVLAKVLDHPPPRAREAAPDAPAELAAIVDRSLMRDPSSRYPNAGAVAKEIGAYLDGRTVGAYEYSAYELMLRFVRRHRAASLAVGSIAFSIIVASILVYRSFLEESRARAIAETARDEAMEQRTAAESSMIAAESAVADALLERAERALGEGDASAAAVFAAGVLVREADATTSARHVRALSLYLEADARRRYQFERIVAGAHVRSELATDGRVIAIPTETAIRVVNLDDGSERRVELRASRVRALGANGLAVIAGDAPGIYDLADGRRVAETPAPTSASITDAAILVSAADGTILVRSPDGAAELARWTSGYRGQVRAAFSPTGDRIAVVTTDVPELELWPWPHAGEAECVPLRALPYFSTFAARGDRLAVLTGDAVGTIRLSPVAGEARRVRDLPERTWPSAIAWTDDTTLAVYEDGDRITLRDAGDGRTLDVVHLPAANGGRIEASGDRLVFFPSESRASLGDATVMRRSGGGGRDAISLNAGVRDVQLDSARHRVIAATLSAVWTIPIGTSGHLGPATQLVMLPPSVGGIVEHARVAADGSIVLFTLRGGLLIAEQPDYAVTTLREPGQDYSVSVGLRGIAISPDGSTIYFGSTNDSSVQRWERHGGRLGDAIAIPGTTVQSLAISPDGARIAIGGHDGTLRIALVSSGSIERTIAGREDAISALTFSPRGDRLATADQTGRVRVIDVHDGHVALSSQPLTRYVNGISWSADGRWIVTASDDSAATVLSAMDLAPVRIIHTGTAPISAAFASDSSHLLFHDGRSVVQLELRMGIVETAPGALLTQAEQHSGVHLSGLMLTERTP